MEEKEETGKVLLFPHNSSNNMAIIDAMANLVATYGQDVVLDVLDRQLDLVTREKKAS